MKGVDNWGLGGNEVYKKTGTFIHPWRPDYGNNKISEHNPKGQVLYIDHVTPALWFVDHAIGPDAIGPEDFARLRPYFDAAVKNIDKGQINTWGFVTHETEYQMNYTGLFRPTNPINVESIKALDNFLKYIDNYKDKIRWVTTKDIYKEFEEWEKR